MIENWKALLVEWEKIGNDNEKIWQTQTSSTQLAVIQYKFHLVLSILCVNVFSYFPQFFKEWFFQCNRKF